MKKTENPCNGCNDRTPFCHIPGNCKQKPTYHQWKEEIAKAGGSKIDEAGQFLAAQAAKTKRRMHRP